MARTGDRPTCHDGRTRLAGLRPGPQQSGPAVLPARPAAGGGDRARGPRPGKPARQRDRARRPARPVPAHRPPGHPVAGRQGPAGAPPRRRHPGGAQPGQAPAGAQQPLRRPGGGRPAPRHPGAAQRPPSRPPPRSPPRSASPRAARSCVLERLRLTHGEPMALPVQPPARRAARPGHAKPGGHRPLPADARRRDHPAQRPPVRRRPRRHRRGGASGSARRRAPPLLTMQRTTFDDTGRAVEFGSHIYRASRYAFDFQLLVRP